MIKFADKFNLIKDGKTESNDLKLAKQESKVIDENNKKKANQHKHKLFIISIYILWGIAILILITRTLHFILPYDFHWLCTYQLQSLDKFLFSGSIGGLLGKYGTKIIN